MKDYEERDIIFIHSPCNATDLSALLRTAAEVAAKQYLASDGWQGPFVSMGPPPPPAPPGWRVYVCRALGEGRSCALCEADLAS